MGLFLLDAYGGSDSFLEMDEERDLDGFTYIWDQHHVNPITGDVVNYIHFEFPRWFKNKCEHLHMNGGFGHFLKLKMY